MRLRNALAIGTTAATIVTVALTGPAAMATAVTARAGADSIAGRPAGPYGESHAGRPAGPIAGQSAGQLAGQVAGQVAAGPIVGNVAGQSAGRPASGPVAGSIAGQPWVLSAGQLPAGQPADSIAGPVPVPVPVATPSAGARPGPRTPEDRQPTCGKASDPDFPIATRIHGGPAVQHPGGDSRQWSVDLTNTTDETCSNIHPVIVFTGRDKGLTAPRIQLEFRDEDTDRWLPVVIETTAEEEVVGVLDGVGFSGFAVPARKSLTVDVRLALAADTPPNAVTVNAAIVQRKGDDGEWVGESGDYRFDVVEAEREKKKKEEDGSGSATAPDGAGDLDELDGIGELDALDEPDELATTGMDSVLRLAVGAGAVLLCCGGLALAARRFRAARR
ncbi:hypothetical protein OG883_26365 [Streptomyces sp. NBC_01142]|uniref:hypothetical protein n=1 Tax=Streptomyces sp. NBC_01142 TaxID=2975865 RepID=UPI0022572FD8|nr:hypothetical protein [Streptomyces sp. NBC_01142]MCX4823344.1 hypothetical protein [Streptomyces sp. NBC_01142]